LPICHPITGAIGGTIRLCIQQVSPAIKYGKVEDLFHAQAGIEAEIVVEAVFVRNTALKD